MTSGQLKLGPRRRAVAPEHKSERRAAIVQAAEALLRRAPGGSFPVDELARRAGLAKGTVYLYFRTREEVLLAVHLARTHRMFDAIEVSLATPKGGAQSAIRATLKFLRANPEFLPLAVGCRSMLESNIGIEAALQFKIALGERLAGIGGRIEAIYPELAAGQGVSLLLSSYALILGLWQLADPPACLRAAMRRPEMRLFRIDYEKLLTDALSALWTGTALARGVKP
jgi:AcrR family transcriptional regulator